MIEGERQVGKDEYIEQVGHTLDVIEREVQLAGGNYWVIGGVTRMGLFPEQDVSITQNAKGTYSKDIDIIVSPKVIARLPRIFQASNEIGVPVGATMHTMLSIPESPKDEPTLRFGRTLRIPVDRKTVETTPVRLSRSIVIPTLPIKTLAYLHYNLNPAYDKYQKAAQQYLDYVLSHPEHNLPDELFEPYIRFQEAIKSNKSRAHVLYSMANYVKNTRLFRNTKVFQNPYTRGVLEAIWGVIS